MPYIFVRSEINQGNVAQVFRETKTYIDLDQNSSPVLTQLRLPLTSANAFAPVSIWQTWYTNMPAYVVLNALETCGYKAVAASSIPIGTLTQYMWTLQG